MGHESAAAKTIPADVINPATTDEFFSAASRGDLGVLHRMISRGFDQDATDGDHRTPLHHASAEGRTPLVRYLLDNGALVNRRDRWGETPLDQALRGGHHDIVEALAACGATRGLDIESRWLAPDPVRSSRCLSSGSEQPWARRFLWDPFS